MIAEARILVEMDHGMWRAQADQVTAEQSTKNLIVMALRKIRNMLGPMGLTKSPIQKHRTIEPIDPAIKPFSSLQRVVRARANHDAQMLLNGQGDREEIGQFWGIRFPSNWYDVHTNQHGNINAEGQFDDLIRQTEAAAEDQPVEIKIKLLNRLAIQIRNS